MAQFHQHLSEHLQGGAAAPSHPNKGLRPRAHWGGTPVTQAGGLWSKTAQPVPGGWGLCPCWREWELAEETESFSETLTRLASSPRHQPHGAIAHLTQLGDSPSGTWPEGEEGTGGGKTGGSWPSPLVSHSLSPVQPVTSSATPPTPCQMWILGPLSLSDLCLLLNSGQGKQRTLSNGCHHCHYRWPGSIPTALPGRHAPTM